MKRNDFVQCYVCLKTYEAEAHLCPYCGTGPDDDGPIRDEKAEAEEEINFDGDAA